MPEIDYVAACLERTHECYAGKLERGVGFTGRRIGHRHYEEAKGKQPEGVAPRIYETRIYETRPRHG